MKEKTMIGQQNLSSLSLKDRVRYKIEERRTRLEQGKINSISSPFKRFKSELIGIQQRKMYLISSFTKGSKTQFTSFFFIITPLLYAYQNPNKIRIRFFMYLLEETKEDMMARLMCHMIYKLSDERLEVSMEQLMSIDNDNPIPDEALAIMDTEEFNNIIDFFESHTFFSDSSNPTGKKD